MSTLIHDTNTDRLIRMAFLAAMLIFFALPIVYLFSTSFKTPDDVLQGRLLPDAATLKNYPNAFAHIPVARMIGNSVAVALLSGIITLVIAVPATYATIKLGAFHRTVPNITLASYAAPPIIALVPLFYLLQTAHLMDSIPGLALVHGLMNLPVAFWLLKSFVNDVPAEIDEAAWIDGAGYWHTLFSVILPLIFPGILATALICIILSYNEFLFASALTFSDTSRTITVGMSLFQGERLVNFGQMAAASFVGMMPIYLIAFFFQKYLVGGLTQGSIK
ncbi:carbohydrate ABC transporter permease [Celeribacter baekdonensis]|jgi:multiple sugar transport system permease protein|uniref:carbohydrate ABC transporter permease n=1 Tax=Celeribacter baekdonensis TaxID=875171 RepID=UPI0019020038|nr:carbohydrate ABC transporter permease [Celeribacter baekdonensis]